jgi:hypothetical protein
MSLSPGFDVGDSSGAWQPVDSRPGRRVPQWRAAVRSPDRRTRMAGKAKYVFIASMDVDPEREAIFNEVYDTEHIPLISKVPGVVAARRNVLVPLKMFIGGEVKTIVAEGEPKYSAIYELESPDVLTSEAWAKAVDAGRWPSEVRPYTRNRRHTLRKLTND